METDPRDAQAALDAAAAAERRSAIIATSTPWYAPWYGLTGGSFPVASALIAARADGRIVVLGLGMASLALLISTYKRVTGVWPSTQGMAVPYVVAGIVMAVTCATGYLGATAYGVGWWVLALGLVSAVLLGLSSVYHDHVYARKHGAR